MGEFHADALCPEAFHHVDEYVDCFARTKMIPSDLLYGEENRADCVWLSVVIPTFQRGQELREAIQSVLTQETVEYTWEILVVDNTPLDADGMTPALKEVRQLNSQKLRYYHNRENLGSGYNWSRGAELARGEWICFLHDDDVLYADALKNIRRQIKNFRGSRPLGYLHARRSDFAGMPSKQKQKSFPPERLTRFGVMLSGCTGAGAPSCGTTILKKAYLETGGINYDFGLSADAVLCYQIMKNYEVRCSNRFLGGYRWSVNESLKPDALLQMVQADELLSCFTYQKSPFAQWWGNVFGAASSWRNIHRKQVVAQKNGIEITKDDFRRVTAYPEPTKQKKLIFLGIYALYRLWRLADGWVRQLIIEINRWGNQ